MSRSTLFVTLTVTFLFSFFSRTQTFFQTYNPSNTEKLQQIIKSKNTSYFLVDLEGIRSTLQSAPYRENIEIANSSFYIQLPGLEATVGTYRVVRNQTMHPDLNVVYPNMLTFDGVNVNNPLEKVKFDVTPQGFHAMIYRPDAVTVFIDPIGKGITNKVMLYSKKDFYTDKVMSCEFGEAEKIESLIKPNEINPKYGSCQLRTYKLALAATAEYTAFHGNATLAAAAQVTTMNRVNGVFEKDIAITMTIVPNNNLLIYTNATTDPYTNGNAGAMITEKVSNCNAVIGSANYNIGHVFGTNSGGLAGLGVVCGNNKARGVTGSSAPVGDPFDIDYVAHEIGHQFNANHTQNNNCNRNNPTAVEPGSASTIMGYAGICTPNVQSNSDDHFHGISLSEMTTLITSAGHTCPVTSTLANAAPIITGTNGNTYIPAGTPFALTCTATDINNDPLTYNWEQINNEVSTQAPVATATSGPNFRSFPSTTNPTRYFPRLSSLASNGPYTWEVVPSVSRVMNFRCSVRDNNPGPGGCSDHENVTINTVATAGPFVVSYPTSTGIVWAGTSSQTVTWAVANTTAAPINAALVNIYLSTDGGLTYPTLLASATANDGSHTVSVPNIATTTARIMVISSAGTFFDVSDNNFQITASVFGYSLSSSTSTVSICQGSNGVFSVNSNAIGGFSTPIALTTIGLPVGTTFLFSPSSINPGQSSVLTVSNAPVGSHTFTVQGDAGGNLQSISVTLVVQANATTAVTLLTPTNGAINVSVPTNFTWTTIAGSTYNVEISNTASFTSILDQASGLASASFTSSVLAQNTLYYWRVSATNGCGTSPFAQGSFTTNSCSVLVSANVPITISPIGTNTISSIINVTQTGTITGLKIPKIQGTHSYVSDLTFRIKSPTGTIVNLAAGLCNGDDNFDFGFDNAAATSTIPCPPVTGLVYQPTGNLNSLVGEASAGVWTLEIVDGFNQDGGVLSYWSLELCVSPCTLPTTPVLLGPSTICAGASAALSVTGNLNDATQWNWYTGSCGSTLIGTGTTLNVNPVANTTYYVRGEGGCVSNATCGTKTVAVTNLNTNVNQNGTTLTSLQVAGGSTYQWLLCSDNNTVIPNANQSSYTPSLVVGSYAVQVANSGCVDTSACFTIDYTGIDAVSDDNFSLLPNPTNGSVTISWKDGAMVEKIQVYSLNGKLIMELKDFIDNQQQLDISNHASGLYHVRIHHATGIENRKLIKSK